MNGPIGLFVCSCDKQLISCGGGRVHCSAGLAACRDEVE